jgi:hypothetical protein
MPAPSVQITKQDGNTGVVRPSAEGVLAIIAPSASGTANVAATYTRQDTALADYGYGKLVDFAAYDFAVAGKPVVLVKPTTSTAGANGTVTKGGAGTSTFTAAGTPNDDLAIVVRFLVGGTIGVAGITYQVSLDGGNTYGAVTALGTANSIAIPNTGATLNLGAGTIVAGNTATWTTTSPAMTTSDLTTALEALRVTSAPWDAVLIEMVADDTVVALVDTWLKTLGSAKGKFKTAIVTCRRRNSGETSAAYQTALATIFNAAASTDIVVCADAADMVSPTRGIVQPRSTGIFVAARGMKNDIGRDVAYVNDGPVLNARISDSRGNPKYHDEGVYPGIDDIRLTTLKTFDGLEGVYITNANLLSPTGSDFVYWQHARCLNRGCEIAWQMLTRLLSAGVNKSPKAGPNGERYIAEEDAQRMQGLVQAALDREIVTPGRVSDMEILISRTDDLSSNAGATITCELQSVSLAYVKKFNVTAKYVKAITNPNP